MVNLKLKSDKPKPLRRPCHLSQKLSGQGWWGFTQLSRLDALRQIKRYLRRPTTMDRAYHLILLFNIQAEELAEVGVSYEVLKTLEHRCCF